MSARSYGDLTKAQEHKLRTLSYSCMLVNDIVCCELVDLIDEIKISHLYRQYIKKLTKQMYHGLTEYEKTIRFIMQGYGENFAELNEAYNSFLSHDITIFRFTLKQSLDRAGFEESDIGSRVYCTYILCKLALDRYRVNMEDMRKYKILPPGVGIRELSLKQVIGPLSELARFMKIGQYESYGCGEAVGVIMKKLNDSTLLDKAFKIMENIVK